MTGFDIFKDGWVGTDTVCGWGSRMEHTQNITDELPMIINKLTPENSRLKVNDAGCGDLWWIRNIRTTWDYVGYDLYPRDCWEDLPYDCRQLNICEENMRDCDLIICRDVFIHWPNEYVLQALERFRCVSKYLYSTSYTGEFYQFMNNGRLNDFSMHHSKLNLCSEPFNLGRPIHITPEDYEDGYSRKVIALWKL